jgi:hypothetical protein
MDRANNDTLCPSSGCKPGRILLGIIDASGRVRFMPEARAIDTTFVRAAREGRPPEQRFRFSSPCVTSGCDKWDGAQCGVARTLTEQSPQPAVARTDALPSCAIRPHCRWHGQHGDDICFVCEWVVTSRGGPPSPLQGCGERGATDASPTNEIEESNGYGLVAASWSQSCQPGALRRLERRAERM